MIAAADWMRSNKLCKEKSKSKAFQCITEKELYQSNHEGVVVTVNCKKNVKNGGKRRKQSFLSKGESITSEFSDFVYLIWDHQTSSKKVGQLVTRRKSYYERKRNSHFELCVRVNIKFSHDLTMILTTPRYLGKDCSNFKSPIQMCFHCLISYIDELVLVSHYFLFSITLTIDMESKILDVLKNQSIEQFLFLLHEHLRLRQPLCLYICTVKDGGCFLHHLDNQDEQSRLIGFRKNRAEKFF